LMSLNYSKWDTVYNSDDEKIEGWHCPRCTAYNTSKHGCKYCKASRLKKKKKKKKIKVPVNSRVKLTNLKNAANMNGKEGLVVSGLKSGRHEIKLAEGMCVMVKPENLKIIETPTAEQRIKKPLDDPPDHPLNDEKFLKDMLSKVKSLTKRMKTFTNRDKQLFTWLQKYYPTRTEVQLTQIVTSLRETCSNEHWQLLRQLFSQHWRDLCNVVWRIGEPQDIEFGSLEFDKEWKKSFCTNFRLNPVLKAPLCNTLHKSSKILLNESNPENRTFQCSSELSKGEIILVEELIPTIFPNHVLPLALAIDKEFQKFLRPNKTEFTLKESPFPDVDVSEWNLCMEKVARNRISRPTSHYLGKRVSLFNHSCTPNAVLLIAKRNERPVGVVCTIRKIKESEEICLYYHHSAGHSVEASQEIELMLAQLEGFGPDENPVKELRRRGMIREMLQKIAEIKRWKFSCKCGLDLRARKRNRELHDLTTKTLLIDGEIQKNLSSLQLLVEGPYETPSGEIFSEPAETTI